MFLDVAQGDSTVLELPGGKVVLIDGGATYERFDMGRGVVAPYLWNRGIKSIDHVIATHPQLDHVGGLTWVIKHFSVKNFWGNGDARDEMFYRRLKEALDQRGLSEQIVQAGDELRVSDGCRLGIENPPALTSQNQSLNHGRRKEGQGLNNRSVVTRLTCGRHSVLFSADIEQAALLRLREQHEQPVSVLKVPHHGAVSSLDREWIASLHPRYAVVSVGRHNPYGHPASPVLAAYAERGISLFRTDRDGGVWIVADQPKDNFEVQTTRALSLQRTHIDIWMLGHSEKDNWYRLWRQWRERM